jgi:hypothetical protein
MGSIPGGDENFPQKHKKKDECLRCGAGKPSTYFERSGTFVSQCGITQKHLCIKAIHFI